VLIILLALFEAAIACFLPARPRCAPETGRQVRVGSRQQLELEHAQAGRLET